MRKYIKRAYHKVLVFLRLTPLSLARKVQLAFGAAVIFILSIALLLPYIWMSQLTKKAGLDAGRAASQILLRRHFRTELAAESTLVPLDDVGKEFDANDSDMQWLRLEKEKYNEQMQALTGEQKEMVGLLIADESEDENISFSRRDGVLSSSYVRVFRATDSCISCHNPQSTASPLSRNELIGAVVIQRPAGEVTGTKLFNLVCIVVAGLIGGTGAIVAFYMITQRVILRPIRQLRALANNVAEGNLDTRSAIKTGDEYEKLSDSFNHMLDGLQAAQEKLRQANKQLDDKIAELSGRNIELFKANKVKSEFLANISHEFRTPLNSILGFAQVLKEKPKLLKQEKAQRYIENIITGGNRLLNMINDLLDLAKTEAGKLQLHIEKASVQELLKSLVASFSLQTKQKKIKVKLTIQDEIPVLVTDAGKIQQILYNFLSNAVKFTPQQGRIEISAQMLDEKMLRFAVTDTGCGIDDADKEKIFEKFRQADGTITRESTGSGLGLAISKELANMLAGSIGFQSEPKKGSTFWLDIPVTLTREEHEDNLPTAESQA